MRHCMLQKREKRVFSLSRYLFAKLVVVLVLRQLRSLFGLNLKFL